MVCDDSGEEVLLKFIETLKSKAESGRKAEALWSDFSQKWFTLMPSTRPFIFRDYQELAEVSFLFLFNKFQLR